MTMERHQFFTFYALISFSLLFDFSFAYVSLTPTQSMGDSQTLVSPGQHFELGFFSPGSSKNRYLGIWHKKTPGTVVWVANRNNPITDSYGVLTVSNNGIFLVNQTKIVIWSSNLSREAESPVAELLDSGNLVVRENISMNTESYLWQSFDYPSDTRLPGMKMGWNSDTNRDQYFTSWKNDDDPSLGDITYRIDNHGLPQMIISSGSIKKFRSGPWNGLGFSGFPLTVTPDYKPTFVFNDSGFSYMYEPIHDSFIMRLTVNQSGSFQRYILNERSAEWALIYLYPNDMCDSYGQCGANGICRINNLPICECLKGYKPKSQEEWDGLDWSSGCVRSIPLTCQSGEGFLKVKDVKLPDLLKFWLNTSMNLKECKAECLKNCSCTAYANSNINGSSSGCLIWFGDLIDIRMLTGEGSKQDIYIRLPASELESNSESNKNKRLVAILVASIISGILLLSLVLWCIIWEKRTKRRGQGSKKEDLDLPLFDLATIAAATDDFSRTNMIGAGGFGPVYKGNLSSGQEIAVKRLSRNSRQGLEEFKNEVILIAKLQHRNLVKLLGCCIQGEETMLIYEYMTNKSLDYFIFDQNKSALLTWQKRFNIALGIARGLLYLHQDSRLRIIHRDLKPSNILLDSDLNPKISDFGLARIFGGDQIEAKTKRVIGTYGYMSPEYAIDGKFSTKSDVFSLGVLLLEIVSGKKNRGFHHPDHHHSLLGHAWLLWSEDRALELIDACMKDYVKSQVLRCIQVSLLCVQKLPQDRPEMSFVVFMLDNEGAMLPQPKQPGFFIERSSIDTNATSSKDKFHTVDTGTITILEAR